MKLVSMGYLYKRVAKKDEGYINAPAVEDIYSLAGCISEDFMDYMGLCKNNNYWLFNNLEEIHDLARDHDISLVGLKSSFIKPTLSSGVTEVRRGSSMM